MRKLFIPVKANAEIRSLAEAALPHLPKKLGLLATAQHLHQLDAAKEIIERAGKTALIGGQITGCNLTAAIGLADSVDAFVLLCSGSFHALGVLAAAKKPVVVLDLAEHKIERLGGAELAALSGRRRAALASFYHATDIGVLICTKPGQGFELARAFELERRYPDKRFYYLLCDDVRPEQLENFSFVQCWLNTACPRIAHDDGVRLARPVVNMEDI